MRIKVRICSHGYADTGGDSAVKRYPVPNSSLFKPAERPPQQKRIQQSNPRKSDDKPRKPDNPEINKYGKRAGQRQDDQEQEGIGKLRDTDDKRVFQRVFDGIFKPGNIRENVNCGK